MSIRSKGRCSIIVNEKTYFWYVALDDESPYNILNIARDSVKALLTKAVRTIYNTHMHKLGEDAAELTRESSGAGAASLIMRTENGRRSFKVALAQPEGSSYAKDIAEKYGVTYDMLIDGDRKV